MKGPSPGNRPSHAGGLGFCVLGLGFRDIAPKMGNLMDDKIDAGSIVIGGFGLLGLKDPFLGIAM